MCGFAGFISFNNLLDKASRENILHAMGASLARRGPDDQQFYDDGVLSFVFRRLSIVDLEGGQQPIWNEDSSMFVAVNGEIYNHRELRDKIAAGHTFRSQSDSEVVLHLYEDCGTDVFQQLNGMFASVIWDTNNQQLVIARDRLGIKPLYYALIDNGLIFGSELKALLNHPECPKTLSWDDLDLIGAQQRNRVSTYVDGISYLQPGTFASLSKQDAFSVKKYWQLKSFIKHADPSKSAEQFCAEYSQLLEDSVLKRLMSDVPVGLFLSGGVDSSIIASIVANHNLDLHCFTVAEKTTIDAGDVQQAIKLCDEINAPLYTAFFDVQDIAKKYSLEKLEQLIALIESPRFDPEWLFKNELHKFAKHHVPDIKVILLGQGADEFAGGYSNRMGSIYDNWRDYMNDEIKTDIEFYRNYNNKIPERFRPLIEERRLDEISGLSSTDYHSKMELLTYQLQHFNLWHEDRSSSFNGLEARVPFLDHRLVELLASIPDEYHEELFWDKAIVRSALKKFVPTYPIDKPKVPFFATGDTISIDDFTYALALKIYPEFRKKYLETDSPLLKLEKLDIIYQDIKQQTFDYHGKSWMMLELMSTTIFASLCNDQRFLIDTTNRQDTDIVPALSPEQLKNLDALSFIPPPQSKSESWNLTTKIKIPDGVELLSPLASDGTQIAVILSRDGIMHQRINIPESDYWAITLLDQLSEEPGEIRDIDYWSNELDIEAGHMVNVLSYLVSMSYLESINV